MASFAHIDVYKRQTLYINGIKVGSHDVTAERLGRDQCGDTLFMGNPTLCISELAFYNQVLSDEDVYNVYRREVTDFDSVYERKLKHIYTGAGLELFKFIPDEEWEKKLDLSLNTPKDLDSFYIQGLSLIHI